MYNPPFSRRGKRKHQPAYILAGYIRREFIFIGHDTSRNRHGARFCCILAAKRSKGITDTTDKPRFPGENGFISRKQRKRQKKAKRGAAFAAVKYRFPARSKRVEAAYVYIVTLEPIPCPEQFETFKRGKRIITAQNVFYSRSVCKRTADKRTMGETFGTRRYCRAGNNRAFAEYRLHIRKDLPASISAASQYPSVPWPEITAEQASET